MDYETWTPGTPKHSLPNTIWLYRYSIMFFVIPFTGLIKHKDYKTFNKDPKFIGLTKYK